MTHAQLKVGTTFNYGLLSQLLNSADGTGVAGYVLTLSYISPCQHQVLSTTARFSGNVTADKVLSIDIHSSVT